MMTYLKVSADGGKLTDAVPEAENFSLYYTWWYRL